MINYRTSIRFHNRAPPRIIQEEVWRKAAQEHQRRIYELIKPGLIVNSDNDNDKNYVKKSKIHFKKINKKKYNHNNEVLLNAHDKKQHWTGLNPKHPVYNFLIEYYGLKGMKGVKRLIRWSPKPEPEGVLLVGATENDIATSTLHLRGAIIMEDNNGILYNPSLFFNDNNDNKDVDSIVRSATPFLWYHSVLQQTLNAEPVLFCYGLHEWAMQYMPTGEPEPPSGKYQSHLPLRVKRSIINEAVERKGIYCTHVDALRYFAPAAKVLNHNGPLLERHDQLHLEQPACVHAHMDLLKIALKLSPFIDGMLLQRVLDIALQARQLDVAASPYDATQYNVDIIPIETTEGRMEYKYEQKQLMDRAAIVRRDLFDAYNDFITMTFSNDIILAASKLIPNYDHYFATTKK